MSNEPSQIPLAVIDGQASGPTGAAFPGLRRKAVERTTAALVARGYSEAEVKEAIQDVESEHPFLDIFTTYILPILLKLLENLILAKRAASGQQI